MHVKCEAPGSVSSSVADATHWPFDTTGNSSAYSSCSLQLLTRLLKSSHPEDLQAANRLIKSLVKEVGVFPPHSAEPALDRAAQCVCAQLSGAGITLL